jgi:hypothetical protein
MPTWQHHDPAAALAALGLTPAQAAGLRRRGCPLPSTGPVDELAVRLWNRDADRPTSLTPPGGDLAPYGDFLAPRPTPEAEAKPADRLKEIRADHEALKVAERKSRLIAQGQQAAADVLDQVERTWARDAGSLAGQAWAMAHGRPRAAAEPDLIRLLKSTLKSGIRRALDSAR